MTLPRLVHIQVYFSGVWCGHLVGVSLVRPKEGVPGRTNGGVSGYTRAILGQGLFGHILQGSG